MTSINDKMRAKFWDFYGTTARSRIRSGSEEEQTHQTEQGMTDLWHHFLWLATVRIPLSNKRCSQLTTHSSSEVTVFSEGSLASLQTAELWRITEPEQRETLLKNTDHAAQKRERSDRPKINMKTKLTSSSPTRIFISISEKNHVTGVNVLYHVNSSIP